MKYGIRSKNLDETNKILEHVYTLAYFSKYLVYTNMHAYVYIFGHIMWIYIYHVHVYSPKTHQNMLILYVNIKSKYKR